MDLIVRVEPASLEKKSSGSIYGKIWVEVDGVAFPSEHWTDFPVKILAVWLFSCTELRDLITTSSTFNFMDGPYSFVIAMVDSGLIVSFIGHDKFVGEPSVIEASRFMQSIVDASRDVLEASRRWGPMDGDLDLLERTIAHAG